MTPPAQQLQQQEQQEQQQAATSISVNIIDASNFDFLDYLPELNSNTIDQTITTAGLASLDDNQSVGDVNSLDSSLFSSFQMGSQQQPQANANSYYSSNQQANAFNFWFNNKKTWALNTNEEARSGKAVETPKNLRKSL